MKASKKHWQVVKKISSAPKVTPKSTQFSDQQPRQTPVSDEVIAMALLFW